MANGEQELRALYRLIEALEQSLEYRELDRLTELDSRVRDTVAPVMTLMESGQLDANSVTERLKRLQAFCDNAEAGAKQARSEAEQALKGVNRNRNAARAYQNISSNRSK